MNDEHDNRQDDNALLVRLREEDSAATDYAYDVSPSPSQNRARIQIRRAFLAGIEWQRAKDNGEG